MLILNYSWAVWLAWLLAAFFLANGLLGFAGFKPFREGFTRWGFPRWFYLVNAAFDVVIGGMIASYPTRPFGLLLSLLLCVVIWITLIRCREYGHLPASVVLFAITLVTGWGLRLI
jgi:hypothetical protein